MAFAGASLGSIQPGLGTAIGAVGGVALDWGINAFQEWMSREEFIDDNAAALDATIVAWKEMILPEIERSINVWFDDAQAATLKISKQRSLQRSAPIVD
jgi:phage tail tape-measure protein